MKRLLVIAALLLASACTSPDQSREALEKMGFSNIETGGHDFFTCGDDYTFSTHFTATNPAGRRVEGTACCGVLKGCSIKF